MSILRFGVLFFCFAILLAGGIWIAGSFIGFGWMVSHFWLMYGALAAFTLLGYSVSWLGMKQGGKTSVMAIMAGTGVKMLFSMSLALLYILKFKPHSISFALNFIIIYFLFSAFEIWGLLTNLRLQNRSQ